MTDDVLNITQEGPVALIGLNNPPVNALGAALRQGLSDAIRDLDADPSVKVIALYGEGRALSAGADIREFGKPPVPPRLPDVLDQIEGSDTPVVAVMHGTTLGGGLELALAAHARVVLPGARLGLPEVTLGLLPGAGGTQRLPRLVPLEKAIGIISTGRQVPADEALELGLADDMGQGTPQEAARAAAQAVLDGSLTTRPTGGISVTLDREVLDQAISRCRTAALPCRRPSRRSRRSRWPKSRLQRACRANGRRSWT